VTYIECRHLCKSFGNQTVLKDVSLRFEGGHIYGIVGRNGAGKTVLLKLLCGFLPADSGTIDINGRPIRKDANMPENVGAIIETPGFLEQYNGAKNLKFLAKVGGKIGKEQVYAAMRQVGLDPHLRKHVRAYSLGMRQRLGIAQAIMENPDILILDEPMNSLDTQGVEQVRKLLTAQKEEGKLILLCTHVREDVELLCDEVYRIRDGVFQREGVEAPVAREMG
jgi:ABC-2 type transport system ATP-binding protein